MLPKTLFGISVIYYTQITILPVHTLTYSKYMGFISWTTVLDAKTVTCTMPKPRIVPSLFMLSWSRMGLKYLHWNIVLGANTGIFAGFPSKVDLPLCSGSRNQLTV